MLSRSADTALVKNYSKTDNAGPLFFRPIRTAVAAYENWVHAPLNHAQISNSLDQLLNQPPSDFDNRTYVDRTLQQWNAEDPTAAVQVNVQRIAQLIPAIERRGARVLFFELPCSTQLEGSRFAEITHEIVRAAFADPGQWLHIDYARSELRWADGVHLDERSALIVTQSIDKALSSLISVKSSPRAVMQPWVREWMPCSKATSNRNGKKQWLFSGERFSLNFFHESVHPAAMSRSRKFTCRSGQNCLLAKIGFSEPIDTRGVWEWLSPRGLVRKNEVSRGAAVANMPDPSRIEKNPGDTAMAKTPNPTRMAHTARRP